MSSYLSDLDRRRIPNHVAIVMDGNGRWAKQRGLPRTEGHAAGEQAMFDTVKGGVEVGLGWLTMFAFSTENWRRPKAEVKFRREREMGDAIGGKQIAGFGVRLRRSGVITARCLHTAEAVPRLCAAGMTVSVLIALNRRSGVMF